MGMEARVRSTVFTLTGLALMIAGSLVFVSAYFLLPLYVTTWLSCFDSCSNPVSRTMWEFTLNAIAHLEFTPIPDSILLVLCYTPLLVAAVGMGGSIAYCVCARRAFAVWSTAALIAGFVALFLMLPVLLLGGRPDWGYLGMLLGYALLWAGSHLLLSAPLQPQAAL
jgi:hypothetical protein